MGRLTRHDYRNLSILIFLFVIIIIIITRFTYVFGSAYDWQQQHCVFPEYFRTLFYTTHNIFPNFAMQIGGGQNIYNFSYYGFLNPVMMISYLLPFVKMTDYVIASSIVLVIAGTVLFYIWLKRNQYTSEVCFLVSLLFMCAGPVIFQSHKQLMFVNYIPFLILGLLGVDHFLLKNKSMLLIISTFLMILSSYYFSIGGIVVLMMYSLYRQIKMDPETTVKSMFLMTGKLAVRILIAVFMSGMLLLPTFSALLDGRNAISSAGKSFDFSLLIPGIHLQDFVYNSYSLGLTSIALIALISAFISKKKERIILSIFICILTIFPVLNYVLNGTLYLNTKVFIPFLPLACIVIADYISDIWANRSSRKQILTTMIILGLVTLCASQWDYKLVFLADAVLTCAAILLYQKTGKKKCVVIPLAAISIILCIVVNLGDNLVLLSDAQKESTDPTASLVRSVIAKDPGFFRVSDNQNALVNINKVYDAKYYQTSLYSSISNPEYFNLVGNIFNNEESFRNPFILDPTQNVLFNIFMGNKYFITDKEPPIGYRTAATSGNLSIYENDSVLPLGYVTDAIMSESDFDKLDYPYTAEALLKYGVVQGPGNVEYSTGIVSETPVFSVTNEKNLTYTASQGIYDVHADDNAGLTVHLKDPVAGKLLFIRFQMDRQSPVSDLNISINQINNILVGRNWTYQNNNFEFDYVLSSNTPMQDLQVAFGKGDYQLSNLAVYTLDYADISNMNSTIDPFNVDTQKTQGDVIAGTIHVTRDGYFILHIPYAKGFTILVDGKKVDYEEVNKAFIGFKLDTGEKNIQITYQAPMHKEGLALSLIGVGCLLSVFLFEYKRKRTSPEVSRPADT